MAEQFGCCSKYMECSEKGTCINPNRKDCCQYWIYNLSKGRNLYFKKDSKKENLKVKKVKDLNGNIYEQLCII